MKVDMETKVNTMHGTAFDVGQNLGSSARRILWNSANNSGVWSYVEPQSLTPTWVHFDKRFGTPACSTGGFPLLKRGSISNYVLIAQDDLNTLRLCNRRFRRNIWNGNTKCSYKFSKKSWTNSRWNCGM